MIQRYKAETAASITALARRIIMTNLCKEIVGVQPMEAGMFYAPYNPKVMTKSKYNFSRNWYEVKLMFKSYDPIQERIDWCEQTFGPQPKNPDAWSRWYNSFTTLRFRDEKDYQWFVMRWGA